MQIEKGEQKGAEQAHSESRKKKGGWQVSCVPNKANREYMEEIFQPTNWGRNKSCKVMEKLSKKFR